MAEIINLNVKWEYKMTPFESEKMLNDYGQDGWELAGVSASHLIFKRPIVDNVIELEKKSRGWWDYSVDVAPVSCLIDFIEKEWFRSGFAATLARTFNHNGIKTVGDLLLIGRTQFKRYRQIGKMCISSIDETLNELYNIKNW